VPERPALWAGKGMYLPRKVVEAAIVGALARATMMLTSRDR
jgi:hypothetical protein